MRVRRKGGGGGEGGNVFFSRIPVLSFCMENVLWWWLVADDALMAGG